MSFINKQIDDGYNKVQKRYIGKKVIKSSEKEWGGGGKDERDKSWSKAD